MANYNRVILMGNLTRDPELKFTPSGTPVCNFGMAVNRVYNTRETGERKEEVCFVDVTAWGRESEIVAEYTAKGSPLFIEGRLTFHQWETEDGQRRSKLTVTVERVQLMRHGNDNGEKEGGANQSSDQSSEEDGAADDGIPF